MAIGTRIAVLAAGLIAALTIGYEMAPSRFRLSHNELWNLPGRFDAGWYLGIARRGYRWDDRLVGRQQNVAFFPAFPLAMRVAGDVVTLPARALDDPTLFGNGDTRVLWGGVLLSIGCFAWAAVLLHTLTELRLPNSGGRVVALLATYPFALYFSAPYSEGMFLLSVVAAFLAMERKHPLQSACWSFLAGLTRSSGWALSVGLALLVLRDAELRQKRLAWTAALAPLLGTMAFSLYLWRLTGHPLAWIEVQRAWGHQLVLTGFVTHRFEAIAQNGLSGYVAANPVDPFTVLAVLFTVAGAWVATRRLGAAYGAYTLASLAPALAIDAGSLGRFTSVLFPAFMAVGSALSTRQVYGVATVFLMLQLWLAARFFTWQTPF
jgi:hypothetical protein